MSLITDLADAITRQEGPGAGTAATRYNNPGNLMDPNNRIWPQFSKAPSGEVIFPDPSTGRAALENDLSIKVNRGMTLTSLLNMYAPSASGNDTAGYIRNVSSWTGLPVDVPLNSLSSSTLGGQTILDAINPLGDPSSQEAGSMDWGLLAVLGAAVFAIWWIASD